MRLAIYGASGFIGCHLLAEMLRDGHRVRALVRSKTKAAWLQRVGVEVVMGDIRDAQRVHSVAVGCDIVFHLVTNRFDDDNRLDSYLAANVIGTENVMSAATGAGVRRLVFTSSINVYGRLSARPATEETPASPILYHDCFKLEAERIVLQRARELGICAVVARLPWVFGPGQPRFRKTFRQITEERSFPFYGRQDPWRNVAHVNDVVDGLKRCVAVCAKEPRLYLLPGHNATLSEILHLIADEAGVRFQIKRRPLWLAERVSQACRLVLVPFGLESRVAHGVEFFVRNNRCDGSKARHELGYEPKISLRETIRSMLTWYRDSNYADSNEPLLAQMAGSV
jgi:nucleoside-diphosphate-sugar epimerase